MNKSLLVRRASDLLHYSLWGIICLPRDLYLAKVKLPALKRQGAIVVLICVRRFHPVLGGSEFHTLWIARELKKRGYEVIILTERLFSQRFWVQGIPITNHFFLRHACDVLFSYSSCLLLSDFGKRRVRDRKKIPWLHHPCAQEAPEITKATDAIVAMNSRDIEIGQKHEKLIYDMPPFASPDRECTATYKDCAIDFQSMAPYLLWVGAWLPAKGVQSLCRRFKLLKARINLQGVRLVMFGGYGNEEYALDDDDIIVFDRKSSEVPAALKFCEFLCFNSPPAPVGYDANPLILVEAFMNGKAFLGQRGTPFLLEVSECGILVDSDEEWVEAAWNLLTSSELRNRKEAAAKEAVLKKYNQDTAMDALEKAIKATLSIR